MIRRLLECRCCKSKLLEIIFSMQQMPLVDDYRNDAEIYPVDLVECQDCGHIQLGWVIERQDIFGSGYRYSTGYSPATVQHFKDYAREIWERRRATFVIDVGANDGTFLTAVAGNGFSRVLGIDPSGPLAKVPMIRKFFSKDVAVQILHIYGRADVVTANNVLAHATDMGDILDGVRTVLAPDGLLVIEVGYLLDIVISGVFETIYHEHLSYFDLGSLLRLLDAHGFEVVDAKRIPTHGGSLRVYAQLEGHARQVNRDAILSILQAEIDAKIPESLENLDVVMAKRKAALKALIPSEPQVIGFGASAKACVLMWQFDVWPLCVIDDNPRKQGLVVPGTDIPIKDRSVLERHPDCAVVILAWNEAEAIMKACGDRRFILASPEPREVCFA